jgi:hypothetical protein
VNFADACRLLEVDATASLELVRASYRRILFASHPDHGGTGSETRALVAAMQVWEREKTSVRDPISEPERDVEAEPEGGLRVGVTRIDDDTLALPGTAEEAYRALVGAAHEVGVVTYVDRDFGVLEVLLKTVDGTTVSLFVSFQGRSNETVEAFFSLEAIDKVRGDLPTVFEITELLASYLHPHVGERI